jgi:acyl-coenzyme A thioesterase PaaI-like protein
VTTRERQNVLESMREQHHRTCPVCGDFNAAGLRVTFDACPDGSVQAVVICGVDREGYAGHIHGGVIASLLDGAMANCLFSHGIHAVTGELTVRMRSPIESGKTIIARAWIERGVHPLYHMNAELEQGGTLSAKAKAKFMYKAAKGGS